MAKIHDEVLYHAHGEFASASLLVCLAALGLAGTAAAAEGYPQRPIRLIVPFPPGGGADILARTVGEKLAELWRRQIVIDNRGGAGGTIGTNIAAKAQPDGYTLLMASSNHPINASLYTRLPYHPVNDFTAVMLVASAPLMLVVHPTVAAKSVKELIALAKARPGQLNFGSAGSGSTPHLAGELFKLMAGIDMLHVPYKGSAQALTDLLGGQLSLAFNNMFSVLAHVKSGKLRALGVSSSKRSIAMRDVPTVGEAGVAGYEVIQWWGVLAPARTPQPIIAKVNADLSKVLQLPDMKERLAAQGVDPAATTPAQFDAFLKAELEKWTRVVKESGARAD